MVDEDSRKELVVYTLRIIDDATVFTFHNRVELEHIHFQKVYIIAQSYH